MNITTFSFMVSGTYRNNVTSYPEPWELCGS